MGKSLSKRVFTLNLALSTLFRHDTSIQCCYLVTVFAYVGPVCVFSVCIPSTTRLFTMKKHLVPENLMELSEVH